MEYIVREEHRWIEEMVDTACREDECSVYPVLAFSLSLWDPTYYGIDETVCLLVVSAHCRHTSDGEWDGLVGRLGPVMCKHSDELSMYRIVRQLEQAVA